MANTIGVCLLLVFCCANLSFARQLPKECSKGPSYWCQSLRIAADCGAVGHCSSTVWETKEQAVHSINPVSDKFIRLFRQLKDVKDLINEDYLATRIESACHDVPYPAIAKICKDNTAGLEQYVHHVLKSETSPQTICAVVGMCNNEKLDNLLAGHTKDTAKKPLETPKKQKITFTGGLLGATQCSWGPSYWCSNFSTSHECKATSHCVTRIWPKMAVTEDNDSICKICTDMVKQARDQLQSNETQEELKEVFEGSCQLIRIKIVRKECIKLADDFVPELVETLSSEMNPQQVCSVAGLCNNAKIDDMLVGYNTQLELRSGCNNCSKTAAALRRKFDATSYEDFLYGLLQVCRRMDSLSDSCSMLVFKYFENILEATRKDLTSDSVCHVSGQCAYKYHQHDEYDFPEQTAVKEGDDIPCELCEQLVKHMRDTMIANTTEIEFYKVLQGLCKQSGKFKDECLHLAEQYYPIIYTFLTKELNPAEVCGLMGICSVSSEPTVTILLPEELKVKNMKQLIGNDERNSYTTSKLARVPISKSTNVRVIDPKPASDVNGVLPIERMFISQPQNKAVCSFCEYFLHYLQVELSDTNNIERVTEAVDSACEKLPKQVNVECKQFVDQYGPSVVALLVQEIDPASICPALGLCPQTTEVHRVTINSDKSSCPLCLFAVEQLKAMLKDDRSEENIRKALDGLCTHLSTKLRTNCIDFVDSYSHQLVEMLSADLDPQEICVYLKLCKDEVHDPLKITHNNIDKFFENPRLRGDRNNFRGHSMLPKHTEIETNEIPDNTVNGRPVSAPHAPPKTICVVCEFVMKELDEQIKDKHNDDDIMNAVHNVCKHMPKSVRGECDQFVQKYGEMVISLLAQELEPAKICAELKLCPKYGITAIKAEEILDCAVCETVVMAVKKVLANDKIDHDIVKVVEKSCALLPAKYSARCHTMMEIYGDSVIHLIEQYGTKGVCQKIGLCSNSDAVYVKMYREKRN